MMGKKNYLKEDDGRSKRLSRLSPTMQLLMRSFPRQPRQDADLSAVDSVPLAELLGYLPDFQQIIAKEIRSACNLSINENCYTDFVEVLAGKQSDALLHPGVYLFHEVQNPNRIFYIGSGVDMAVRHRIVNHLCPKRNKHGLLELVKEFIWEMLDQDELQASIEELENSMRIAIFSRNRWTQNKSISTIKLDTLQAIRAIETGAFDLTVIRLEKSEFALTGLLEDFLLGASQHSAYLLPPLNTFGKCDRTRILMRKQRGDIPPEVIVRLQTAI